MAMYPANALLPEFVIQKMAREVPVPSIGTATFQEYANYFNGLNASKMQNVGNPKQMVTVVGDAK